MKKVKILIVEDELITATSLKESLTKAGYSIVGVASAGLHAIELVKREDPDIILLDIKLKGNSDGIETASQIKEFWNGPLIFITGSSESETVNHAKKVNPNAYLIKPYRLSDVLANIDMAIHNFYFENPCKNKILGNVLFLPVNGHYEKIEKKNILYIEASGSYISIATKTGKKYMLSTNLKTFENQLNDTNFMRVSRKHVVNMHFIHKLDSGSLYLESTDFPIMIGDVYRKNLLNGIQIIRTK